jgi:hypothetical protein
VCFLFPPIAFIFYVFPKFPFVTTSFFVGVHFDSNLEVLVTTPNEGYKRFNK